MQTGLRSTSRARRQSLARTLLLMLPLAAVSGCDENFFSSSSSTGGAAPAAPGAAANNNASPPQVTPGFNGAATLPGTHDAVVATASVSGTVAVVAGASRTISVIFNSDDGLPISGLGISGSLGMLPPGWSGPASFACDAVGVGSSCVLNLTYAPAAVGSGVLTLSYVYLDDATQPKTGSLISIPYEATANDNVVAAASPAGQIGAILGASSGMQAVLVNFTTDDGDAATHLALTSDLTALPAGWSSTVTGLSCAIVSTGSGCELALRYAPTAAGSGTLTLGYSYTDETGAAKTGALNIPYATTAANNVVAMASPAAQITAIQKTGGQSVAIAFTTDDGRVATQLFVTSNLAALPAGWSSAAGSFSCASLSSGNGCQLQLNYAPAALGGGTLSLSYAYLDSSGAARSGLLNLGYTATTNDNIVGAASPAGPITAVISDGTQPGNGTQAVSVTFATDDGRPATALALTSDLTALPSGWSSTAAGPFVCQGINADNPCRLSLAYAPTHAGAGTLVLDYTYDNNAGETKTGSVNLAYTATENDNVQWSADAAPTQVRAGSSNPVNITFQTDDGNPAGALKVATLATLPAGWSSPATSFSCATVSAGTACTLPLTFTPTVASTGGALALGYSYINNAGYPSSNTVTLNYSAYTPYLYVVDTQSNSVSACALGIDNTPGACTVAAAGFNSPSAIAVAGNYAYVADLTSVSRCALGSNGSLTNCTHTGAAFVAPSSVAVNPAGSFAYINDAAGLTVCAIALDGSLGGCAPTGAGFGPLSGIALTAGNQAFSVAGAAVDACNITAGSGALAACGAAPAATPLALAALAVQDNVLYVRATSGLYVCPIYAGSLSGCQTTAMGTVVGGLAFAGSMASGNATAYLSIGSAVLSCPVGVGGVLAGCTAHADPTFSGTAGMALRPQ